MNEILETIGVAVVRISHLEQQLADQAAEIEKFRSANLALSKMQFAAAAEIERLKAENVALRAVPNPATQDDLARVLARFDAGALRGLFEETITLFLEYRDQHGYVNEEQATRMAVRDSVDDIYAIAQVDAFEAEMKQVQQ